MLWLLVLQEAGKYSTFLNVVFVIIEVLIVLGVIFTVIELVQRFISWWKSQ